MSTITTPAATCITARSRNPGAIASPTAPRRAPARVWETSFPPRKAPTGPRSSARERRVSVLTAPPGAGSGCRRRATAPARRPPWTAAQDAPPASNPVTKTLHRFTPSPSRPGRRHHRLPIGPTRQQLAGILQVAFRSVNVA